MMQKDESPTQRAGIPVDVFGVATIDPTKNVLDLVNAANQRQDDLREAAVLRLDSELAALKDHLKETMIERDKRYEHRYDAIMAAVHAGLTSHQEASQAALLAQREAIQAALAAQDRAVSKAEMAAEKRFEGVNEFRAQLGDQQRTLMPRVEAENRMNALAEKIGVLEGFRTEQLSKGSGAREGYGFAIGVVGLVLALLSIISIGIVLITRMGP